MTLDVIGSGSGGEVRKVSGAAVGPAALWTTRGLTPGIGCDVTSDVIGLTPGRGHTVRLSL